MNAHDTQLVPRELAELPEGMLEREIIAAIHAYRVRFGLDAMRERVAEAVLFEIGEPNYGNS